MNVAIDGGEVRVELELPLASALGFERAPRTAAEREQVTMLAAKLRDPVRLLVLSAAAQCTLESTTLRSSVIDNALLGAKPAAPPSPIAAVPPAAETHADLEVTWAYRCRRPGALHDVRVGLFAVLPKLTRVALAVAGPAGQKAATLTPRAPSMQW